MRRSLILLPLLLVCLYTLYGQEVLKGSASAPLVIEKRKAFKIDPALQQLYKDRFIQSEKDQTMRPLSHGRSGRNELLASSITLDGKVLIKAVGTYPNTQLLADLKALGLQGAATFGHEVSGFLPISSLPQVEKLSSLAFMRISLRAVQVGAVANQADHALKSDIARENYGVDGSGVKIGVLSDSYNTLGGADDAIASGDLPGPGNPNGFTTPITVLKEFSGVGSDEGRGMLELIHDIAPGAALYFYTAFEGEADFANGILALADAGCQVIVDDVSYLAEPYFQDGIIAQAVDQVHSQGIAYFSSAGNYASNSYQAAFNSSGEELVIDNVSAGIMHDFDTRPDSVNTRQSISLPATSSITFGFQWVDNYNSLNSDKGAASDLDIHFAIDNAIIYTVAWADLGQDPVNVFSLSTGEEEVNLDIIITKFEGEDPPLLKYIMFSTASTINTFDTESSTSFGHANAAGANGVGAVFYGFTPAFGVTPPILESFSSTGGMPIYYDLDGELLPQPEIREKPDYCAPDGSNTSFFGSDIGFDVDSHPNFFGTSAAAPHAAAVAALMVEASGYTLGAEEIRSLLIHSTVEMQGVGFDYKSGYGLIQAEVAVSAAIQTCEGVTITQQPLDKLFCPGGEVEFRIEATASSELSELSYLWQKRMNVGASFVNLDNNLPFLSLDEVEEERDGEQFRVIITDDKGTSFTEDDCRDTSEVVTLSLSTDPPALMCMEDIVIQADSGVCSATVTYSLSTTVSCGIASLEQVRGLASGEAFPVGETENTWVLTDSLGNRDSCTFLVTILDVTPPVFIEVDTIKVSADPGACTAVVQYDLPLAVDLCGMETVLQIGGKLSGSAFPVGVTLNTFVGIDEAGNRDTVDLAVEVMDTELPQFTAIDTTLYLGQTAMVGLDPLTHLLKAVSDNCGIDTIKVDGISTFSCDQAGRNEIRFTLQDIHGNITDGLSEVWVIADSPTVELLPPSTPICSDEIFTLTASVTGEYVSTFWEVYEGGNWNILVGETEESLSFENGLSQGQYAFRLGIVTICDTLYSSPLSQEIFDCTIPEVLGFSIIDVDSPQFTLPISDGGTFLLEEMPAHYNIIAEVEGEEIEKVYLELTGAEDVRKMERKAPFALFGDPNGELIGKAPQVGDYLLLATPFVQIGDSIFPGNSVSLSFQLTSCEEDGPLVEAGFDQSLSCDFETLTYLNGEVSGEGVSSVWTGPEGFSSAELAPLVSFPGVYILSALDAKGCVVTDSLELTPCSEDCLPQISGYTLIDASTNEELQPLEDGGVLDLSVLSEQLNIRADISCPEQTRSVMIALTGAQVRSRTENFPPYAMAGDHAGEYFSHTFLSGSYTLTATPYSERNGLGQAGLATRITFAVVNASFLQGSTFSQLNENEERWKIYPNPAKEFILIDLYTEEKGTYDIRLLDMMGRVSSGMQIEMGRASGKTYVLSVQDIAEGVYFLEIRHGNALMRKKISVE